MSKEVNAIKIAISSSAIGILVKFAIGFSSGSMSLISSAIDSLGDFFVSVINYFVVKISWKEADGNHNYGHSKIEGLGAMFEGGFIFAAGLFIIYESVHKYLIGEVSQNTLIWLLVMMGVTAYTGWTVWYLRKVAKETGSLVIKADALHYTTDLYVNGGVLLSLILIYFTGLPIIDNIIAGIIGLYMLYSSTGIVKDWIDVVMDKSLSEEQVELIKNIINSESRVDSYHDLKTKMGKIPVVDFHVFIENNKMTIKELHEIFLSLTAKIKESIGENTKVLLHADTK